MQKRAMLSYDWCMMQLGMLVAIAASCRMAVSEDKAAKVGASAVGRHDGGLCDDAQRGTGKRRVHMGRRN
jgi:hypothetical protein